MKSSNKKWNNNHIQIKNGKIRLNEQTDSELREEINDEFIEILNKVITEHDASFRGLVNR